MNLDTIKTFGGPVVQKAAYKVQKFAPEILTGVGIVGGIGAAILGARATLKLEAVLSDFQEEVADLKASLAGEHLSEKEYQKLLVRCYVKFSLNMTKLYGPTFTLGLASMASILGAPGIMRRRQVALIAAYKTVEAAFSEYRKRVVEEFGPEKDQMYRLGIREEKIEDENGKKKTVKVFDPNGISPYAKFFDEGNPNYEDQAEYNLMFLKSHQNWFNDRLRARGFVFLNEVYDAIGIEPTKAGQAVGWALSKDGDNYIDFGIFNGDSEKARDFVNGLERSILLDFNVDGVILDLL